MSALNITRYRETTAIRRGAGALLAAVLMLLPFAVAADSQWQSLEEMRETVRTFLAGEMAGHRAAPEIEVRRLDGRLRLAPCDQPLEAFLPPGRGAVGNVTVGVRCQGPKPWTVYVQATVRVIEPVVVAVRPLGRGEVLALDDLELQERDIARLTRGYVAEPSEVVGHTVRRNIQAGQAVSPSQLSPPKLVRRGERVSILARDGGFEVRMEGEALQDGAKGQVIRVRNLSSGRDIEAVVTRAGHVEVRL